MGLGRSELFLSPTSLLVSAGTFLCPAGDLANINLMKRVALDFRLSLCTLGLPGVSAVLFESAEGKAPSSFQLRRAVCVWFGGWDSSVPSEQTPWDECTSLSPHSTPKPGAALPSSLAAQGFGAQHSVLHRFIAIPGESRAGKPSIFQTLLMILVYSLGYHHGCNAGTLLGCSHP